MALRRARSAIPPVNLRPSSSTATSTPSTPQKPPTSPASPRKTTDTVTVTLAQRLNELAVANSEGLLTDEEYRILRQNLFERFASTAVVPSEPSIVPAAVSPARPRLSKSGTTPGTTPRPVSNFVVERPVSISSKSSGITGLLRRASGRRSGSKDMSDTSSIWSSTSNTSFFKFPRLSKKSSDSSVRTTASRAADTLSISSRRLGSERGDHSPRAPRSTAGSIRKMQAPPSSFHARPSAAAADRSNATSIYNVFDEEHLNSVQEIQQEIQNVEAEAKRLMDAFNGLEVTTLARAQRHRPTRSPLKSAELHKAESSWALDSDSRSQRRINLADDAISLKSARSGASVGTSLSVAPSMARSTYSNKKSSRSKHGTALPSPMSLNVNFDQRQGERSRPTSLHRKNSNSSVASGAAGESRRMRPLPPVPALPNSISQGHLKAASGSQISLVRSVGHLPMNTVPEDDGAMSVAGSVNTVVRLEGEEVETELEDIKRRREEVSERYDARLEYLRAKLKGAQLHEKLMRK